MSEHLLFLVYHKTECPTKSKGPAGSNYALTCGTAKFSSPLSVDDFVKKTQYTYYTREALSKVYEDIAEFADHEGLHGHARSVLSRFCDDVNEK